MIRAYLAAAALELAHLRRNIAFVVLTALAAVSFLGLVCLFGITGSRAPVALIDLDGGSYAKTVVTALDQAHHSFDLRFMSRERAEEGVRSGRLVGAIVIPPDFTRKIERGETVALDVEIDNVNVDLTNDVQRALPAAIVAFGHTNSFPGLRVRMAEHDVLPKDTGYIPYLSVSALALDALVIAGILGALATAREWEKGTVRLIRLSPAPAAALLAGKLSVSACVATVALILTFLMVIGFGVVPVSPGITLLTLTACVAIFTCLGAWLGALLKRTLATAPLLFGLAMPLYIDSGALEPTRFDGDRIWYIAHLSPVYYAVGALEWAYHGLRVTPEPVYVDLLVLLGIAIASLWLTVGRLSKGAAR